jgi:hypothetical protein
MPETTLTCPDCGKTGTVTQELVQPAMGVTMLMMTGLDPDGCEKCKELLTSRGYAVVDTKEVRPGEWALAPRTSADTARQA